MWWCVPAGYYCHPCAKTCGLTLDIYTSDLSQSTYQVRKIAKHTMVSSSYPFLTVFKDAGLARYAHYIVNTRAAGVVQIVSTYRRNIIWLAGFEIGYAFSSGVLVKPVRGITLVLSSDPYRAHVFPSDMVDLATATCARCRGLVVISAKYLAPASEYRV